MIQEDVRDLNDIQLIDDRLAGSAEKGAFFLINA